MSKSHPSWVRGLKRDLAAKDKEAREVAPLVGAWIETTFIQGYQAHTESHPSWVRGLKPRPT